MIRRLLIPLTIITLSIFPGCKKSLLGSFDEGEIHYKIKYNNPGNTLPVELMPNTMVVKFKSDKTLMEIITPIGNYGITNIIDPEANTLTTYINFLGFKYYYLGELGTDVPGIDPMDNLRLEKTGQVENINGLDCKHIIASLPGSEDTFDIWYTNDIDIKDPNNSTPYSEIDGILVNFFYKMGEMIVEFEVENVYERAVAEKDFTKSDKYIRISRDDMDSLISKMMSL